MEHYSAVKSNELTHATTGMNLKCLLLNGRSQTQKAIHYVIPFYDNMVKN